MRNILKNRLALSTVVTTLIILVVSVLLAGVVTYFAINVTSTRVQEEDLALTKQHVWYATGGTTQAAIMVINTGGRDVVVQKLTVRGQEADWGNVVYGVTTSSVPDDISCNTTVVAGAYTIGSVHLTLADATTDLTLQSGKTLILFIDTPDSITINDIGLTVSVTLYTAQAMYYREANVQAYSPVA